MAAGFALAGSEGKPWPNNAMRHSAASYALAAGQAESEVARWMGHDMRVLRQHYDAVISKADARKFWEILPKGAKVERKRVGSG